MSPAELVVALHREVKRLRPTFDPAGRYDDQVVEQACARLGVNPLWGIRQMRIQESRKLPELLERSYQRKLKAK